MNSSIENAASVKPSTQSPLVGRRDGSSRKSSKGLITVTNDDAASKPDVSPNRSIRSISGSKAGSSNMCDNFGAHSRQISQASVKRMDARDGSLLMPAEPRSGSRKSSKRRMSDISEGGRLGSAARLAEPKAAAAPERLPMINLDSYITELRV